MMLEDLKLYSDIFPTLKQPFVLYASTKLETTEIEDGTIFTFLMVIVAVMKDRGVETSRYKLSYPSVKMFLLV